ncbi:MAG: PilZ domain-containing protein [Phycisphaerae bacterium]
MMQGAPDTIQKFRLSDEETLAILELLDAGQVDPADSKRRSERHTLRGMTILIVIVKPGCSEIPYEVKTRNVSKHGIAFLSTSAMVPGTLIRVHLPAPESAESVTKEAVIRHCRPVQGKAYEMGAEFGAFERFAAERDAGQCGNTSTG